MIKLNNFPSILLLAILLVFLNACQKPVQIVKDHQAMADWVCNAIKTNDINLIDSLIPGEQEFLKAMYETKIPDSTVQAQKEMYAQDSFFESERLLILDQFKNIKDTLTKYSIDFSSLSIQDTTPYRYYVNSMMPFVRMDLKRKLMTADSVYYILGIHSCFLMVDGWNLGRLAFYPADSLDLKYFHEPKYIK